jgi:DHA2 family multidrug resistance protein
VDAWGIALLTVGIGALQIVLDKGQREDWFHSDFILVFALISALSLAAFVIVELFYAEHPIVDLRAFKNIPFTSGNVVMFVAFFNLLGSIVLLPLYAQILLGYTATLAGLVLSPGGIATLVTMPVVGKLIVKRNPKYILALGILVCAFSTRQMAGFNLTSDFSSLMWPRIYLGFGMGLLFIPLTTLTLSSIPRPQMGNATSIYNLLRNLGGSIGVAFSTTMFARRAQLHQSHLTEHLTWYDRNFSAAVEWGRGMLAGRGVPETAAEGTSMKMIYGQAVRQATAMGFNDAFWILSVMMVCVLPLLLLMRRPEHQNSPPPSGH